MAQENNKNEAKKVEKLDNSPRTPGLSRVIERNIRTILKMRLREANQRNTQDKIADRITDFSGTMAFVYIHVIWFGLWFIFNTGVFGLHPFDPFPYGLLLMIVNIEAIFLSAFVLISQNRASAEAASRAELDMHVSLLTEHELTQALLMLDTIQKKLGIEEEKPGELNDLEKETRPEDVLAEINRLQQVIKQ